MGVVFAFKLGEPVWVQMEEFPWWPARIVAASEIQLDPGETIPKVGPQEVLVEFFNDDKRFAAMPRSDLRPFKEQRFRSLNRHYDGEYLESVIIAIAEADAYLKDWLEDTPDKHQVKRRRRGGETSSTTHSGAARKRIKKEDGPPQDPFLTSDSAMRHPPASSTRIGPDREPTVAPSALPPMADVKPHLSPLGPVRGITPTPTSTGTSQGGNGMITPSNGFGPGIAPIPNPRTAIPMVHVPTESPELPPPMPHRAQPFPRGVVGGVVEIASGDAYIMMDKSALVTELLSRDAEIRKLNNAMRKLERRVEGGLESVSRAMNNMRAVQTALLGKEGGRGKMG